MPARLSRATFAAMYGPTTGDRMRLADTDLITQVERDLTTYGEEVKFGGGKVIRDGMGPSQISRAGWAADTVVPHAPHLHLIGVRSEDCPQLNATLKRIILCDTPFSPYFAGPTFQGNLLGVHVQ